jgi:hypothetical protein
METVTQEPNDFGVLFPDSPQWSPELVRLVFADGNPDDYQTTLDVPVDDFPVFKAGPSLARALDELVNWVENNVPYGMPLELLEKCCEALEQAKGNRQGDLPRSESSATSDPTV